MPPIQPPPTSSAIAPVSTGPSISAAAGRTTVEVVQSTRRMKFLTVHENELETISAYNSQSATFYSLASASFSIGITIIIGASFTDRLSPVGCAVCLIGIPLSLVLSFVFLVMALKIKGSKNSILSRIKNESADTRA